MFKISTTVALCLAIGAGAALAKDAITNPVVKERRDLMQVIRANTGALGDMASGKAAFDAARATQAKTNLAAAAAQIVVRFEANESDPADEAKPAIWTNYADFTAKAESLVKAAEALDASSLDGVKAGMGKVGPNCKACHETYRE